MTPLEVEMLIWYATRTPGISFPNVMMPAELDILDRFWGAGVFLRNGEAVEITDKGRAWLDMILATPMPVQRWLDPRTETQEAGK